MVSLIENETHEAPALEGPVCCGHRALDGQGLEVHRWGLAEPGDDGCSEPTRRHLQEDGDGYDACGGQEAEIPRTEVGGEQHRTAPRGL